MFIPQESRNQMDTDENQQLIFIPGPGMGHIVAAVELANLIINQNHQFSITFLLITDPQSQHYTKSLHTNSNPRLRFIQLPEAHHGSSAEPGTKPAPVLAAEHIERHQPQVRNAVLAMLESESCISGFVLDMFCLVMVDVASEFNIPVYTFFTSNAAFLSLKLCVLALHESGVDVTEYKGTDKEFPVPGFLNNVPAKVLPSVMLDEKSGFKSVLRYARKIRETKGVLVNTFQGLESPYVESLSKSSIPVYPIGPVLNLNCERRNGDDEIIGWLDNQPARSVVFLCFGSLGSFGGKQIKEIAVGLESSGYRFLWSLGRLRYALDDVLPLGFLDRTCEIGRVTRWSPQVAVLSHPAIGGFVSHCGWNSILESLWFGVPIATWPIYAEQQLNAFEMVVELGMAVEIKMDYREEMGDDVVVTAEEIGRGIKQLMELENCKNRVYERVKDAKEMSRSALVEGGSSHKNLGRLISDIVHNCSHSRHVM